jgi:hypothetical protein
MAPHTADEGLALLLVDGDNLLHHVRGGRDDGGVAWLLPRLRRWRSPGLQIVVALDGHAASGEPRRRRAAIGIEFHHAGAHSADDLIIELLSSQPFSARARTVVVTGDRALSDRTRQAGGLARPLDWLVRRLEEGTGPGGVASQAAAASIGQGRPPRLPPADTPDAADQRPWSPGRGATRKHGNPRRNAKPSRQR